ncbi:hypothetical protein P43SY_000585 [Pythium insidiosum]|uniref:CAMK/CAMKL/AMPK protein kinase n=1 Tax=Pythium insidiosum TaxID=114742 RepID=A0AAD5Q2J6_PYTIN|nr:hypothetical protein P43SY_000585 [Pythium insidiosum]
MSSSAAGASAEDSPKKPSHPHHQSPAPALPAENQQPAAPHRPPSQQQQRSGSRATTTTTATQPAPTRANSGSPAQGEIIGEYVLGETIGKGTFGKVKIGLHLVTGEKVAVKILEKRRIVEPADVERVAREIKILKRNRHVNVIQLYEVIDAPERIFLIMEHADSGEMFEYIVARHRIREPEAVQLFQQIVDGLDYLHAHEVTHRDLKPENLLLQSSAATPTGLLVKIVDFGLSNTHDGGRLLRTACGSPCYAAPEMIQGKLYFGPLADVWSLGVVLFAMVCGYLPFEDSNTNLLYKKILSADYRLPPFLSHTVQDLIHRILETNPEKRFTIEMIRQHPWIAHSRAPPLPRALVTREDPSLRELILTQLEALGLDRDDVLAAISEDTHNALTASYYLLFNKLMRIMKDHHHHHHHHSAASHAGTSEPRTSSRRPQPAPLPLQPPTTHRPREPVPVKAQSSSSAIVPAPPQPTSARRRTPAPAQTPDATTLEKMQALKATASRPPSSSGAGVAPPARRPNSVRGGRNLVFLTSGGESSSPAQRPTAGAPLPSRPPSQGGSSSLPQPRVSISNGMVALTPLVSAPQASGLSMRPSATGGRRHTHGTVDPPALSDGSALVVRRRMSSHADAAPPTSFKPPSDGGKEDDPHQFTSLI